MENRIIVDGDLREGGDVSLPANSEGLSYGFGLFETIKIRDGLPCFFDEHVARHEAGVRAAGIHLNFSKEELFLQAKVLTESMGVVDGALRIVTGKSGSRSLTYLYFKRVSAMNLRTAMRIRLSSVVKGSSAFTVKHKTLNYMDNVRELHLAEEHGFDECLFTNERGEMTECSMANLFFEKSRSIRTPSVDCGLLEGVIRAKVIQIAKEAGYSVLEGKFYLEDLEEAERVFITNSGKGIATVEEVNTGQALRFDASRDGFIGDLSSKLDEMERDSLAQHVDQEQ